ncbi:conserved inner membrane protein YeiH [Rhodovastum atsumiense]|uniref:YeiH family putative sulfate export transporter n=1 Tax=Rhodovastum atsumiense TaxID=504468 RepID=A0A5M6J095_9PROT|nr:YeiH family protein [Rhodovastum atsumiense]KAA5613018.1 YeiH family putative sulfate export transporter [Rhodovastum atsumiense]CAH2600131.1 conserved inner membrane protein YeiH [Rhodovastum atsumiense]
MPEPTTIAAAALPERASLLHRASGPVPGLLLTVTIAAAAYALRTIPGVNSFSPMIIAILLGIALHNTIGTPARARAGVVFSMRRLLRLAIILLGLQLTTQQVIAVGGPGMLIIVLTLLATFLATKALGRLFGVDRRLAELIAAGTSICGASAVIATNSVTRAPDEDVAYAVACVTVFGSLSMFLYPALPGLLHLDAHLFGLWSGASIHEIAQVVAASFQAGQEAGEFGTIAKLSRVMLLAPLVLGLGMVAARHAAAHAHGRVQARAPMPWFVFGFIALIGVNSLGVVPGAAKDLLVPGTTFLLTVALAAMGLETDLRKLRARGLRPLALGAASWLFISGFSLALIELVY